MKKKPICKIDDNGEKHWYKNDKFHRIDGPAIEYTNGSKYWYKNGKCHRINGPAVEYADGTKFWYRNGKCHRIDGPACEWPDGSKFWWLNNKEINPQVLVKKGYITQEELFLMLL